jgi:LPS export ABC transporter protein LptC
MSIRNTFGVALLICAAVASWYWSLPAAVAPTDQNDSAAGPLGYYLSGARLLGTDDDGHITYVVLADRAEELPDQEQLQLHGVQVEYRPENEIPWLVSATAASAPKNGSYLDLTGEVELRSQPRDGGEPTVIGTSSLRFEPNEFSARSQAAVELQIGVQRLAAVGLRAHLKDDSLELESEVHGQFAP